MNIEKSVEREFPAMLNFLREIVKIDSQENLGTTQFPFGEGVVKTLRVTLSYCESLGFRTKNIDDVVGWAEYGTGDELVGIPMHVDIVPEGFGWHYDPFKAEVDNNVIYGRGVCDNKGPVAMLIHVLYSIKKLYPVWNKRVRLIFGTNEETGMACMKHYFEKGEEIPDYGFTPDAMYPIVNGEKGRLHMILTHIMPNSDVYVFGGTKENVVPSSCRISSESHKYECLRKGKSAHASTPEKGENAIQLCLQDFCGTDFQNCDDLYRIAEKLGYESYGERIGIASEDEVFGKTTVNLGILKIQEDKLIAELDIRYGKTISKEMIYQTFTSAFPAGNIIIQNEKVLHYVSDNEKIVKILKIAYEESTGLPANTLAMGGGTYASCFPHMVAFGPKFKDIRTGGHGIDEHMSFHDLKLNMKIYTNAILHILEKR